MTDYKELVKRCKAMRDYNGVVTHEVTKEVFDCGTEAADAIEELLLENDALGRSLCECDDLLKKLERPKWISVEERLPEPRFAREWYLVALKSGCVKTLAYEAKPAVKSALFHEGWHETGSPVSHWMPLPEPPKEEEHDER